MNIILLGQYDHGMINMNIMLLEQYDHGMNNISLTIPACNMMTLYAPFILLGLLRNHHMHHLPTLEITRSSQDRINLGINNTVAIIKWPQGAWSLHTILAQHHEYPTTRYPQYHGDHSRIINGTTLGSTGYLVTKRWYLRWSQPWPTLGLKRWSFRRSQPTYLIIEPGLLLSTLLLILLTHTVTDMNWALIRERGYR